MSVGECWWCGVWIMEASRSDLGGLGGWAGGHASARARMRACVHACYVGCRGDYAGGWMGRLGGWDIGLHRFRKPFIWFQPSEGLDQLAI